MSRSFSVHIPWFRGPVNRPASQGLTEDGRGRWRSGPRRSVVIIRARLRRRHSDTSFFVAAARSQGTRSTRPAAGRGAFVRRNRSLRRLRAIPMSLTDSRASVRRMLPGFARSSGGVRSRRRRCPSLSQSDRWRSRRRVAQRRPRRDAAAYPSRMGVFRREISRPVGPALVVVASRLGCGKCSNPSDARRRPSSHRSIRSVVLLPGRRPGHLQCDDAASSRREPAGDGLVPQLVIVPGSRPADDIGAATRDAVT